MARTSKNTEGISLLKAVVNLRFLYDYPTGSRNSCNRHRLCPCACLDLVKPVAQKPVWIGLYDASKSGNWSWTDGTPLDFENWGSSQPDNEGGTQYCAQLRVGNSLLRWKWFCAVLVFLLELHMGRSRLLPSFVDRCLQEGSVCC